MKLLNIFNLLNQVDTAEYLQTILSLSGTLLGLGFAAFIFVLQDGFKNLKFSRVHFLTIYVSSGKKILYSLIYIVIVCILRLYFIKDDYFYIYIHIIFTILFTKTIFDYQSNIGYYITLNSKKFIPAKYGKFRSYFRKIRNAGFLRFLGLLIQLMVFCVLPVFISYEESKVFLLTDRALIISLALFLFYSIFYLGKFIPDFLKLSVIEHEMSIKSETPTFEADADVKIDYTKEKELLRQYLESREISLDREMKDSGFVTSKFIVYFRSDEQPEAWFNIMIDNPKGSPAEIRSSINKFTTKLFRLLRESKCDINSFAISYHIDIGIPNRNVFFRLTRKEMNELEAKENDSVMYISLIKNKIIDDLFRDM